MFYGASFDTIVHINNTNEFIGVAEDHDSVVAMFGSSQHQIEQHLLLTTPSKYITPYIVHDHRLIGNTTDCGGKIVSVLCHDETIDDDEVEQMVVAVIYEDPNLPTFID